MHEVGDEERDKLRVFISYSRDDIGFADQIDVTLEYAGFDSILDRHGISGAENWQEKLSTMIQDADTIVFVLSSSSAKSEICFWEVNQATRLGKRIVPVLCGPLDAAPPPALGALNYIYFYDEPKKPGSNYRSGMAELVKTLKTDLGWLREHTRYLQRAIEWDAGGRKPNRLLSGQDIQDAKAWLSRQPKEAPPPTALHFDFIKASEAWEAEQTNVENIRLLERARLLREAEAAQDERERALSAERAALKQAEALSRSRRRMRSAAHALLVFIIFGLIGWINQDFLREQANWYFTMRPYMVAEVRPYVLTKARETSLATLQSFMECRKDCPEMVVLPAGAFMMGSNDNEKGRFPDEGPAFEVSFKHRFAVSKYPVTFSEWHECESVGGCSKASASGFEKGRNPVINVNWDAAHEYTRWLSKMTGKTYRLLSEAEWEYAARAGTTTPYSFGADEADIDKYAWYSENSGNQPQEVGTKLPNAFQLHDMHGNVWEWVEDCYRPSHVGAPSDGKPRPVDCSDQRRVARGGGWDTGPRSVRSARRGWYASDRRSHVLGFRIARDLEQ